MTQTPSSPSGGTMSSPPAYPPANDAATSRAATAKDDAAEVAATAKQGVSEVAQEAGAQAREVAGKAKDQARELFGQATSEARVRANEQADRAAAGLEQLAARVQALVSGRPEEAGPLRDYAVQLGERTQQAAEQLRARGVDGVLGDMRSYARRRPGVFLAGAAAAGFMVGRLVKAQRANSSDSSDSSYSSYSSEPSWAGQPGPTRWTDGAGTVPASEPPVYGTVPTATTEIPPVQPYPTPGLEEYPAGTVGAVEPESRP